MKLPGPTILPVIIAGGIGARLAPLSTEERPKPFIPLADGESLLTKTLARASGQEDFLPPLIIGRAADRFALLNHARAARVTPQAILLEESPRNTAPAIALAIAWAQRHHQEKTILAILPADHLIGTENAWRTTLSAAAAAARATNKLCLLGATPTHAEAGFGYLTLGPASALRSWQVVERFIEKPDDPASLMTERVRWNMGQFVGSVGAFALACQTAIPPIFREATALLARAGQQWEFTELPAWPQTVPPTSFDRAVLEKNDSIAVPYTGQWHDLGTLPGWEAATGLKPQDYTKYPLRTDRPWGYFELMGARPNEVLKRLILYPNCRLSRQRHQKRAEQWRVLAGTAYVELENTVQRLELNETMMIPAGKWHRLANHHTDILIIEERQMGICDEADIERTEDDYGRLREN